MANMPLIQSSVEILFWGSNLRIWSEATFRPWSCSLGHNTKNITNFFQWRTSFFVGQVWFLMNTTQLIMQDNVHLQEVNVIFVCWGGTNCLSSQALYHQTTANRNEWSFCIGLELEFSLSFAVKVYSSFSYSDVLKMSALKQRSPQRILHVI